ncbi:arginine--tRNA ligase [Longimicrobium sp.]|uniref:arginine--tRNA ligase n=1 Tax=Longimicrobium sp. TaxID=2029185 RepID=UPI002B79F47C|nr:arginine--tRNA ligase [Longimicrobium sp.]HSU13594.1 arginine--tRNA ligase [Longimicrobium sp.]
MAADKLQAELQRVLGEMGVDAGHPVTLERPRNPDHGDWATNVALTLAKPLRRSPRQIADELAGRIDAAAAGVSAVEVAGPGFINFRLAGDYLAAGLQSILSAGADYGRSNPGGGRPVMVEFVSANPTGPLHIGHGRQAALGDAVSELLAWAGWKVHREFYYNDAGEQIMRLARSVWARYQQESGADAAFPEDGYHGEYVREIARELIALHGERWKGDDSPEAMDEMRRFAVARLREEQNRDLDGFGVRFDEFFLESSLYTSGRVEDTIRRLRETGHVYEKDGAVWLRTTEFGDDKDRVMVKSTGHPTYFLPDVAYHLSKWERGFRRAINVQGSDHHGTTARVRAGLRALGLPEGYPEYVLHQMVLVMREGVEVKFSKRAGDYVTLRELYDEVGVDVARYFFLMRRAEAQLTFDIDLALDRSDKNPVYKVQYAHARMSSIFRRAEVDPGTLDAASADLSLLSDDAEAELVKLLLRFPEVVAAAAERHAPHALSEYAEEVAGAVNSWYHAGNRDPALRVIGPGVAPEVSRARLVLARAVQIVLRNGLAVLGITAPERMQRESGDEAALEAV